MNLNIRYIVQRGGNLLGIKKNGSNIKLCLPANPLIIPSPIINDRTTALAESGQEIVIPREGYGYKEMVADLNALTTIYPILKLKTIGYTVAGRAIPAVQIGRGPGEVHYNGSFHANEWITTVLLMKFMESYARAYQEKQPLAQFDINSIFDRTSLWIVPMVNPDGVELVQKGIQPDDSFFSSVIKINRGSHDFSKWKANIHGVDLNDQFPACWEEELARRNIKAPAPRDYPGVSPLSEPEAKSMADFTCSHDFRLVCAFHTQGEEIYWGYRKCEPLESHDLVQHFCKVSGYKAVRYVDSDAGYKDWFIQDRGRPGFTVECGSGTTPLPINQFWDIWSKTVGIFLVGLNYNS